MHGHGCPDPEIGTGLDGFRRVHMHHMHEPARHEGADRNQPDGKRPQPGADLDQMRAIGGVTTEDQSPAFPRPYREATPEHPSAVERRAGGEVLHGQVGGRGPVRQWSLLPPVQLHRSGHSFPPQVGAVSQSGDDRHGVQAAQGRQIHVVIVIVAEQHRINRRQPFERDCRSADPLRPGEGEGAATPAPDRVGQQGRTAGEAQQKAAVADEGDRHMAGRRLGRGRLRRVLDPFRPGRPGWFARQAPEGPPRLPGACAVRVEEAPLHPDRSLGCPSGYLLGCPLKRRVPARVLLRDIPGRGHAGRACPRRPARSVTNCQATRPERLPRVTCHSLARACSSSRGRSRPSASA